MKHLDQVVWVEKELKYCNAFLFVRRKEAQNICTSCLGSRRQASNQNPLQWPLITSWKWWVQALETSLMWIWAKTAVTLSVWFLISSPSPCWRQRNREFLQKINSRYSLLVLLGWTLMKSLILISWQKGHGLQEPQQQLAEEKKIEQPESFTAASSTWLSKTVKVSFSSSGALEMDLWYLICSYVLLLTCWLGCDEEGDQEMKSSK